MTALIGWTAAAIAALAAAGFAVLVLTTPRRCDCCDHPDLDDAELVSP